MLLIIILIVVFLSFLILIHELGHFLAARFFGLKVDEFGVGFPPRIFAVKKNGTEYSLNWFPLGGFVKIHGEEQGSESDLRSFNVQAAWKKSLIIVAGVLMNFIAGWLILTVVLMVGSPQALLITEVQSGSPAEISGLLKNDRILTVQTGDIILENINQSDDFFNFVNQYKGRDFSLKISREGEIKNLTVASRVNPPVGQGSMGVKFFFVAGAEKKPFISALFEGLKFSFQAAGIIFKGLYSLLTQSFSKSEILQEVIGPVGIFSIAVQAKSASFVYFLQLIGLISVNLAVLNIIPFPALDGGRLFFILIEKIKGSPLTVKSEKIANAAGLISLLLLMAIITIRDIVRLF